MSKSTVKVTISGSIKDFLKSQDEDTDDYDNDDGDETLLKQNQTIYEQPNDGPHEQVNA